MLDVKIISENEKNVEFIKQELEKSFPGKNGQEMYNALLLYDKAFMSAREYFAFYYVMGTETVIDFVNSHKFGGAWEFLNNSVFDMGINVLYRFYGEDRGQKKIKEERILQKCKKAFG